MDLVISFSTFLSHELKAIFLGKQRSRRFFGLSFGLLHFAVNGDAPNPVGFWVSDALNFGGPFKVHTPDPSTSKHCFITVSNSCQSKLLSLLQKFSIEFSGATWGFVKLNRELERELIQNRSLGSTHRIHLILCL